MYRFLPMQTHMRIIMPNSLSTSAMKQKLKTRALAVEEWLETCLHSTDLPMNLREAMEYSLLAGGKRIRPVLCLTCAKLCNKVEADIMPFAAAIEMIHSYSLIHDDLPAMDDDDLRRGKPSSHIKFGEAMAILAGDALLTDAFAFMSSVNCEPKATLSAISYMACAAGSAGMVGGQVLDMDYTGKEGIGLAELRKMHSKKTGALIKASCVCGAMLANADASTINAFENYGIALGTAFQIADDILDITADTATLGKPSGSDAEQGKNTYPSLVGLEKSRELALEQKQLAISSLDGMDGEEAEFLRAIASYVVDRTS